MDFSFTQNQNIGGETTKKPGEVERLDEGMHGVVAALEHPQFNGEHPCRSKDEAAVTNPQIDSRFTYTQLTGFEGEGRDRGQRR